MVLHEFFDNVNAFAKELAFAFATLFSRAGDEALEPRRCRACIFNGFNLGGTCFECGFVQVFVNGFLLFRALAVNRGVHSAARSAVKRLVAKAARTAVTVKAATTTAFFTVERTAFAVFIAVVAVETAFTTIKAAFAAVTVKTTVATIPTERGLVAKGTAFVVVTARAAFRSFTDSEFTIQRDSYSTLRFVFFFTHSFSINCLATDSPSISKIL